MELQTVKDLLGLLNHGFGVQQAVFGFQFPADKHVLVDGQIVDQAELLVDKGDSRAEGVRGGAEVDGGAIDDDLTAVGGQHAAQYVHQCGLARAVLAQQGADLPALNGEVHVLEHVVGTEGFADAAHLQCHGITSISVLSGKGLWLVP